MKYQFRYQIHRSRTRNFEKSDSNSSSYRYSRTIDTGKLYELKNFYVSVSDTPAASEHVNYRELHSASPVPFLLFVCPSLPLPLLSQFFSTAPRRYRIILRRVIRKSNFRWNHKSRTARNRETDSTRHRRRSKQKLFAGRTSLIGWKSAIWKLVTNVEWPAYTT